MDIPTSITDVNDVISATDECQLNMNNLGHEWYFLPYDCQTMLDATGDSTSGDNYTAPTPQPLHRNNTSAEHLRFRSSPLGLRVDTNCACVCVRAGGMRACGEGVGDCMPPSQLWCPS